MVSANPTGPIVVSAARNGALWRLRRATARVRRARGGARVLLQRRGRAARAVPRVDRRAPARRAGAGGRLPRRLRRRAGQGRGRSGAADARVDRGDDGALSHPLRQLGAAERARAAARRAAAAARHLRVGRRVVGALVGVRRRSGLGADPVGRSRRRADVPGGRRRVSRRQARSWLRPRDLRARRRSSCDRASGTRRSLGCSATTPTASRSCSTSSFI